MKVNKKYEPITYQVGSYEVDGISFPITETLSIIEQKDIEQSGLSVSDVIDMNISSHRDWQCDC